MSTNVLQLAQGGGHLKGQPSPAPTTESRCYEGEMLETQKLIF